MSKKCPRSYTFKADIHGIIVMWESTANIRIDIKKDIKNYIKN